MCVESSDASLAAERRRPYHVMIEKKTDLTRCSQWRRQIINQVMHSKVSFIFRYARWRDPSEAREARSDQWCSGKYGVGGTFRGLGAKHPAESRGQSPWSGGQGAKRPLEAEVFRFRMSQGRGQETVIQHDASFY